MTEFRYSVSLIVPAASRDAANALAKALGRDKADPAATFSLSLSADGSEPATHFGCHAWADQGFVDELTAAAQGQFPAADWSAFGLTEADVAAAVAALSTRVTTGGVGFNDLAAAEGLQRVEVEP